MRIAFAILAAGLATVTPAVAQDLTSAPKTITSLSSRPPLKSGVMTVNGKSFPIFRLQGGDIMADVIPAKAGQPMHTGPKRHEALTISVDAEGLAALKAEAATLLAGQTTPFNATITYNGRKLTIISAHLSRLSLPSCNQSKAGGDLTTVDIRFDKVIVETAPEPAQTTPAKLTGCTVALDGFAANAIRSAMPGPYFVLPSKETGVGEMRVYDEGEEDGDAELRVGNATLLENSEAPGLAEWARNDLLKGMGESKTLQIVYATAAGPVLRVSYGRVLVQRVTLDLNTANRVTFATENAVITKP